MMDGRTPVTGFELTPDLLRTQGQAMRRLAHSLLDDEHAAEDVVQETWAACLRRPEILPERVSAWLNGIARRLALRRARDDGRRRTREADVARPEPVEGAPGQRLEREEALRRVTLALLALDEPYRTVLMLRYHDDRTPTEIARELGVPLATVKSRLARGLEALRTALARDLGPERRGHALALVAGIRLSTTGTTSATIGGLALGAKTKLVAAVVVVLCGVLFVLRPEGRGSSASSTREPAQVAQRDERGASPEAPRTQGEADESARLDEKREAVPEVRRAETLPTFPAEAGFTQTLTGRLRDARDLPVSGAEILLAPQGLGFNLAATTDDEGRFTVEFVTRRPTMTCAFQVQGEEDPLGPLLLEFHSGHPTEVELAYGSSQLEPVAFKLVSSTNELGEQVFEIRGGSDLELVRFLGGSMTGGFPEMAAGPDGRKHFVDAWVAPNCPVPPVLEERETSGRSIEGTFLLDGSEISFSADFGSLAVLATNGGQHSKAPPPGATIHGFVRDSEGRLLAGVEVGYGPAGKALERTVESDESGGFELTDVPAGEWRLRAHGPAGLGRCDERVTIASGQDFAWNPLLERGNELTGRVLLPDGSPLADANVELWNRGALHAYRAVARTNEDGRFAFDHLPAEELQLFVRREGLAFPVRVSGPLFAPGDVGTLTLSEAELAHHTLSVAPLDPDGAPLASVELRLWHEASGLCSVRRALSEDGRFVCDDLPAGGYRVELGGSYGWRDLGTQWLEDAALDLGPVPFPRPGLLEFAGTGESETACAWWSRYPDVLARLEEASSGPTRRVGRAGEYFLCLERTNGEHEAPFELASAATTHLGLADAGVMASLEPAPPGKRVECRACHDEPR